MDTEELKKRLDPPDTTTDQAEQLQKEILEREAKAAPTETQERVDDPKSKPEYTFDFSFKDGAGKVWAGKFTTKILNERERRNVGIMRSMLSGGQPYESLDLLTRDSCLVHAHLAHCLKAKPDWAKKLDELTDPRIVQQLYEEVMAHEAHFLGLTNSSSPSPSDG